MKVKDQVDIKTEIPADNERGV